MVSRRLSLRVRGAAVASMSAFEFFFSCFKLILSQSVAEVMTGFARSLKRRNPIRMGYVTPLFPSLQSGVGVALLGAH